MNLKEGIEPAKSSNSNECVVCLYWCFIHGLKFLNSICNVCHDLTMLCPNLSDIAIITVAGVDFCFIIHGISKSETIHLLENSVLENCGYI